MLNSYVNILMYIAIAWILFDAIYFMKRDYFEKKGLKIYYGVLLVYKKPHSFRHSRIVKKLSYLSIPVSAYGIYLFYATMITTLLAKLGIITIYAKPKLLIPGINITGIDLFYFAIAILSAAIVHELSHALVATSNNVGVKGLGFAVLFILPVAFTEINEEDFAKSSKKTKVLTLSAGPASNIVLALIILLVLSVATSSAGLVVVGVEEKSLASKYGLTAGTVILEVNNESATLQKLYKVLHVNKTIHFDLKILFPNGTTSIIHIVKPANVSKLGVLLTFMPNPSLISLLGLQGALALIDIIRWIYIVNMSLGIINIAPLFITDGGKIVQEVTNSPLIANILSALTLLLLIAVFTP